jgi:hypothetical protein
MGWPRLWVVLTVIWFAVTLLYGWQHWPAPVTPVNKFSYVVGGLTLAMRDEAAFATAQAARRWHITWLLAVPVIPPLLAYVVGLIYTRFRSTPNGPPLVNANRLD